MDYRIQANDEYVAQHGPDMSWQGLGDEWLLSFHTNDGASNTSTHPLVKMPANAKFKAGEFQIARYTYGSAMEVTVARRRDFIGSKTS